MPWQERRIALAVYFPTPSSDSTSSLLSGGVSPAVSTDQRTG